MATTLYVPPESTCHTDTKASSLFADPKIVLAQKWLKHFPEDAGFDDISGSKHYQKARTSLVYKSHG